MGTKSHLKMRPCRPSVWKRGYYRFPWIPHSTRAILFKSMGRMVTPLIGKAVRYASKTGLETGIGLLSDVLSCENVKTAAKRRASAAFQQTKQDALEEVKRRRGPSTTNTPGKKKRKRKGGQKGRRYLCRRRPTADIFG